MQRAGLLKASAVMLGFMALVFAGTGDDPSEHAAGAFALVAGGTLAAAAYAPNTYSVHTGTYERRTWKDWNEHLFEASFRFDRADMPRLIRAMEVPPQIHTRSRRVFTDDEALTVLLLRFNGLNLHQIHQQTGIRPSAASELLGWMYDFVWDRWYVSLLASDLTRWTPHFPDWAAAIFDKTKGLGFANVVGFIDGTLRGIAKPAESQDIYFNGHHWKHGILWQAWMSPIGLVIDLAGPMTGRRHDTHILKKSRLCSRFSAALLGAGYALGTFVLYADAGYWNTPVLQATFMRVGGAMSAAKRRLNRVMSRVRITVEWGFGRVLGLWSFFRFEKGQQLGRMPVGKMYVVAVILTNAHCCLYGNATTLYFDLEPPSLEDYFGQAPPQPAGRAQAWDDNVSG